MTENHSIDSLISTSGEDDFEGLPLFYEGKIIKRISKEEIQGWTQNHPRQPFQKKEAHSRSGRRNIPRPKAPPVPESFERECTSPPPSLRVIKHKLNHYSDSPPLFQAFRTLQELPSTPEELVLPKVTLREEPKEDFVKGRRIANCYSAAKKTPLILKTPILKPLPKAVSESSKKSHPSSRCRSVSVRAKQSVTFGREKEVAIISYPMDVQIGEEAC